MASASIRMSGSAIKVRLMEAENNPDKQMELLESSSIPQAIGVFGFYGEFRTVAKLRSQQVRRLGKRGHIREFNTNKEGKVIAADKLLQGCIPKDTSTASLLAWVEKFVVQWAQVEGALAYINLAYTRVLLDRLKDGGSVEPHQLLLEDVCSDNAAALGADELRQASDFQDELMEVLERARYLAAHPDEEEEDDGNLEEITVDRPVIPELGQLVQTRAADGEEWSKVAVVVRVGGDDHQGELLIAGSEGPKSSTNPHWAPNQPALMRRAIDPKKEDVAEPDDGDSNGISGKAKLKAAKSLMPDLEVEGRLNGFHWAGVHTTVKVEDLCPEGIGPDRDGYSLVLSNCFSGKQFDAFRTELNKYSYSRVSGLLYYVVSIAAPEGGLKQSERVPEPRLMGTAADDVRKHRQDMSKYYEYLTLLNPVRQGAENMLAHFEGVLRQCTNPTMTAKLQDLVSSIREIFRGDSKRNKGPEAFNLIKTELETLERQLRDEEATQRQKTVKFNFTAEIGAADPSMAAAAQSSEKWPLAPCFFAAVRYCLRMKLIDDAG